MHAAGIYYFTHETGHALIPAMSEAEARKRLAMAAINNNTARASRKFSQATNMSVDPDSYELKLCVTLKSIETIDYDEGGWNDLPVPSQLIIKMIAHTGFSETNPEPSWIASPTAIGNHDCLVWVGAHPQATLSTFISKDCDLRRGANGDINAKAQAMWLTISAGELAADATAAASCPFMAMDIASQARTTILTAVSLLEQGRQADALAVLKAN